MGMRKTYKLLKVFIYLILVTLLFCLHMSINIHCSQDLFDNQHVKHNGGHLVKINHTNQQTFSQLSKLSGSNESSPEVKVAAFRLSKDVYNASEGIEKTLKDVAGVPKRTPELVSRTKKTLKDVAGVPKNKPEPMPGIKKTLKDVAGVPKRTPEPVPRTRTYSVTEFIMRAKQDNQFLTRILSQPYWHPKSKDVFKRYFTGTEYSFEPEFKTVFKESLNKKYDIGSDVMVFLHIQKTGGMHLNERFVKELQIPFKCICAVKQTTCQCLNPKHNVWIYSSKFSGWPCGLHADWTQLHRCIPGQTNLLENRTRSRRYFYFTQLRDPIGRYMSEFYHQSVIGGHWQDALLGCGPGFSDWADIRPCFLTETWKGVTLDNFMACEYNLATNRITRMLADLSKSNCYVNYSDRNTMRKRAVMWVESAKENLQKMEYFGFMEDTEASDKLFSNTFKMPFIDRKTKSRSKRSEIRVSEKQFLKLLKLVELDIHTYLFARDLFESRLRNL